MARLPKGKFVLAYTSKLTECRSEDLHREHSEEGGYILEFRRSEKIYCIDASHDDGRMGRFVNHCSKGNRNIEPRLKLIEGTLNVIFKTIKDIEIGTELLWDYGERRKDIIASFPFLAK